MVGFTRRALLKIAGGAALARCAGPTSLSESSLITQETASLLVQDDAAFPIGVVAGDATPESIVLVSRYLGTEAVTAVIWEDRAVWTQQDVQPDADGFIYLEVDGLSADSAYRYAFVVQDISRSAIGNFRTAPAPGTLAPLTFGGTCCTHRRRWPFPVLSDAATRDLAFFVHNGDQVYTDPDDEEAKTRAQYRDVYQQNYQQPGLRALHNAFTFYGTWDDHEFKQNFNPETIDAERFENAASTYYEHVPIRRSGQLWRSYRWGQTAEIFMLDCRSERKPSTRGKPNAQYISPAQLEWLKGALADSPCQFKFIINSVPMASFGLLWDTEAYDRWEGYPAQREALLDFIVNNVSGVWFCSGDFHLGAVGRVERSGPYAKVREFLWGPGGNKINPGYHILGRPQWDHVVHDPNYVMLTCDPQANTLRLRYVDAQGQDLLDVTYDND